MTIQVAQATGQNSAYRFGYLKCPPAREGINFCKVLRLRLAALGVTQDFACGLVGRRKAARLQVGFLKRPPAKEESINLGHDVIRLRVCQ